MPLVLDVLPARCFWTRRAALHRTAGTGGGLGGGAWAGGASVGVAGVATTPLLLFV